MANVIKCPVCGENNLSDQEFCQYCQARLQPLTGNLKGADAPLTPGELPTKKSTADLEAVLPQWLRDARSSAREASDEEAIQAAQAPQVPQTPPASFGADLLAGLHSQGQAEDDEEEYTPDWLTDITGEKPKTKKSQTESSEVRWVELGDKKDFAQPEPASDTPSWLTGITPPAAQQPAEEKNDLTDWFRDTSDSQKPISFDSSPSTPPAGEMQDWLHSMGADEGSFNDSGSTADEPLTSSDTPDWLRAMDAENAAKNAAPPLSSSGVPPASSDTPDWLRAMTAENDAPSPSAASSDAPDWLRAMDAENAAQNATLPLSSSGIPPASSDTPDWLNAMTAENDAPSAASEDAPDWLRTMDAPEKSQSADSVSFSETASGESDALPSSAGDTPDWLKGIESNASSSDQDWLKGLQSEKSEEPAQDLPSWLSATPPPAPKQEVPPPAPEQDADALDIPSWLKAAAPQSSIFDEPDGEQQEPAGAAPSSDTNDWLNAFKSVEPETPQSVPAFSMEQPLDSAPPAFVDDAQSSANGESLFTEMPDWLSIVDDSASRESIPAPITNVDAIAPGDLPSWVQAMRPVDAGTPQPVSTSLSGDRAVESRGALVGLQGVLPAVQGFAPTSKPKAYSIKMQASEEQLAHAALLEQILEAETAPVPIGSFSVLRTSRGLRWLLAFLFFAILTTVLSMQTQIFSMPVGLPLEVSDALQVVQSIPEGAPVLVVFDYEPARTGEIESAAVPMFDQMILLRHPHLIFISTHETGAILVERFISGPLAGHNYQSGVEYLNLGYLPGGQMGVRAFAQDPVVTAPYALAQSSNLLNFALTPAWNLPPLQGMTSLSQFAAFIIVTDNAESARVWIEQTTAAPNPISEIPFVVISSAQAAPVIQPYYAAQQINGLVSGLYGGALFEQNNAGRPGTARNYWDAYSIGMLLAMALILGGGLLNLALGLRDRAAAREAK